MTKIIFTSILSLIIIYNINAQNASVEESVSGIQSGFLGLWYYNEKGLTNTIAIRGEIGLDAGLYGSSVEVIDGIAFIPVITIEPRWFYNLNKRESKSKRVDGNAGNFLSLKTSYHPDIFMIPNKDNVNILSDISLIPTWGIRRNLGKHINYETGIGIGYVRLLEDPSFFGVNRNEVGVNLHLRIGYRF